MQVLERLRRVAAPLAQASSEGQSQQQQEELLGAELEWIRQYVYSAVYRLTQHSQITGR